MTDLTGLLLTDADGVVEHADAAAAELFGRGADGLVGVHLAELLPEIAGEPSRAATGDGRSPLASGVAGIPQHRVGMRGGGGSIALIVTVLEAPVPGGTGHVVTVKARHDRTADVEYSEQAAMSAAMLEANLDALITIDAAGCVVEFNRIAEEMFGYRRADILHRPLHEFVIPPSLRDAHCQGMQRYLETGEGPVLRQRIEIAAMRADGEEFPVELTVTPIELGNRTLFTAFVRDITNRKRSAENLELAKREADVANQAKSRFLATMSHEIRTPMTAVLGAIGLLLESGLQGNQRKYALTAEGAGRSLLEIINDVLDFSSIETGQLELEHADFSIVNVIEEAAELLARSAYEKGIELATWVDPRIPQVLRGDAGRLRQVLINYFDNAVRFTESGAIVARAKLVERARDGSRLLVRFEVEDTGIGIAEETQHALFEEYMQIKTPGGKDAGGSGLGLAICRRLVGLFSGEIGVESDGHAGSTFWFTAWLDVGSCERTGVVFEAVPSRALVVWDNHLARDSLLTHLRDHRIDAESVDSGGSALEVLQQRGSSEASVEILIMNDSLPDMTIEEFRTNLEQLQRIRKPAMYLLENRSAPDAAPVARYESWTGVLTKPVTLAGLHRALAMKSTANTSVTKLAPPVGADREKGSAKTGGRILLVEDSEANKTVLSAMLETAGYAVDCVETGQAALQAVRDGRYGLVLMDLRMPVMDGHEATRRIRALEHPQSKVPIVAMTAGVARQELEGFLEAGADAYITKPVVKADLLGMVSKWLKAEPRADRLEAFEGEAAELVDEDALARLEQDTSPQAVPAMLDVFLKETRERLETVTDLMANGDIQGIGDQAHAMKSSAGTFGARRLHLLAKAVETACRANERDKALALAQRFSQVARNSMDALESFL
jgi:PAS domain S-box-containing protein